MFFFFFLISTQPLQNRLVYNILRLKLLELVRIFALRKTYSEPKCFNGKHKCNYLTDKQMGKKTRSWNHYSPKKFLQKLMFWRLSSSKGQVLKVIDIFLRSWSISNHHRATKVQNGFVYFLFQLQILPLHIKQYKVEESCNLTALTLKCFICCSISGLN